MRIIGDFGHWQSMHVTGEVRLLQLFAKFKLPHEATLPKKEIVLKENLSVENAGVVFVKGANERNEFF